ncbi:MAG: Ppx/GppA phosphatase family protein [Rhizobiaceae bacterium]
MSDKLLGEQPPERPEMNAQDGTATKLEKASQSPSRSRRRRWHKRKKSKNGIQADSNGDPSFATSREGEGLSSSSSVPSQIEEVKNQGFGSKSKSRRSNRRPGRSTKGRDDEKQPISTPPQTVLRGSGKKTKRPKQDVYAALDLGTNNCRLLVAVPQQPGRFKVVDAFSRIVRLGEGLAASGRLSDAAMDRAVEALKTCAEKLASKKVKGVRLIATEACRRAVNGSEFLQRVKIEAGLDLELINRETEARLAVSSCASLVDKKSAGVVLFDIGGGSSELALLDLRKKNRHDLSSAMVAWTSLPHGVVTLSEKYGGGKLVTRAVFEAMVEEISTLLQGFEGKEALAEAAQNGEIHLLGTSGTVTTLAGIHLKLPKYDRKQVDGIWMASKNVEAMIEALVAMSYEERVANPCIGEERADLVLAGCAILAAINKLWPCPRLRVADRGLREGLLTEMMNADNAWQRRTNQNRNRRGKNRGKKK